MTQIEERQDAKGIGEGGQDRVRGPVPAVVRKGAGRTGQVLVEMALILPWFFTIIFTIMEMGNLAFHMILVNHAAYETARYGAMIVTPKAGGPPVILTQPLTDFLQRIIGKNARVDSAYDEETIFDLQAGIMNRDLVITVVYDVPLIFPISSIIMSKPKGSGKREVKVVVRMPVERPLEK